MIRRLLAILLGAFYLYSASLSLRLALGPQKGVFLGFISLPPQTMGAIDLGIAVVAAASGLGLILALAWSWYLSFGYQIYAFAYVVMNYEIFKQALARQHPELPVDAYSAAQLPRVAINLIPFLLLFIIRRAVCNETNAKN